MSSKMKAFLITGLLGLGIIGHATYSHAKKVGYILGCSRVIKKLYGNLSFAIGNERIEKVCREDANENLR